MAYYTTSGNPITISSTTGSSATVTLTGAGSGYTIGNSTGTITYTNLTTSGVGIVAQEIGSIDSSVFTWKNPEEFVDCFPAWTRIESMCKEYPGLKIAFEKFKTTYYLVKDEYDNPKDKK